MKAFCCSVNVHGVVVLCSGGGDTWTLFVLTELFDFFAPGGSGERKTSSHCMGARSCALTGWYLTCKTEFDKNDIDCIVNYLSCCSFLASCSRAWKSMDNNPTRLLTTSIPCKHLRIFFLWTVHLSLMSKGPQSDILTKHGKIGLRSASGNSDRISTSTLAIASKMLALAIESWAISSKKHAKTTYYTDTACTLLLIPCYFCFAPEVQC